MPTKDLLVSNDTIRDFNTTDYNPITMKVLYAITTLRFVSCAKKNVYGIRKRPTRQYFLSFGGSNAAWNRLTIQLGTVYPNVVCSAISPGVITTPITVGAALQRIYQCESNTRTGYGLDSSMVVCVRHPIRLLLWWWWPVFTSDDDTWSRHTRIQWWKWNHHGS